MFQPAPTFVVNQPITLWRLMRQIGLFRMHISTCPFPTFPHIVFSMLSTLDHFCFGLSKVKEASSGPCCAMVLCRLEAVTVLKQLMGDPSVHMARATRPGSLRARFGRDGQRNALHGSESLKVPSGRERKWVIQWSWIIVFRVDNLY